jgi:serine/threonine-protein kinase RsbW
MTLKKNKDFAITIPSSSAYLEKVDKLCTKVVKQTGLSEDQGNNVAIAVTELVNNAIHHGNKNDESKKVFISFSINRNYLQARIKDEGCGFKPDEIGNPLDPENLMKESGRGIFLIKKLMDSMEFNFTNSGTEVIITKKIK